MNRPIDTLISVDKANKDLAEDYAESLNITFCETELSDGLSSKAFAKKMADKTEKDCVLLMDEAGLHLQMLQPAVFKIQVNFVSSQMEYRRIKGGGRNQLIAKAVGLKPNVSPVIYDATAGLGKDAFVLASLGCHVLMAERNPWVRVLLEDGLRRAAIVAKDKPELKVIIERLKLVATDAEELFKLTHAKPPEVIYLDPMFPHPEKRALVKKDMQMLQYLVGEDGDAENLLNRALSTEVERVVVKRPRTDEAIASKQASYVLEGKRNRYDIYLHSGKT
ncbi:MAG: class I SAM-dependent methyltransferase [Opitutales bacterium]